MLVTEANTQVGIFTLEDFRNHILNFCDRSFSGTYPDNFIYEIYFVEPDKPITTSTYDYDLIYHAGTDNNEIIQQKNPITRTFHMEHNDMTLDQVFNILANKL